MSTALSPEFVAAPDPWAVLQLLLRGDLAAANELANDLRVDAFGGSSFGRTDALDMFMTHPLALTGTPQVLRSVQDIAVMAETSTGRCVGVMATLCEGVISRVWVVGDSAPDGAAEAAVAVARDDFMSQLRLCCHGDAIDHPQLQPSVWPHVVEMAVGALGWVHQAQHEAQPEPQHEARKNAPAASSSQAWVMRAFSSGAWIAALYCLRLQTATLPRQSHHRLALAMVQLDAQARPDAARVQPKLAVSDPLLEAPPVLF